MRCRPNSLAALAVGVLACSQSAGSDPMDPEVTVASIAVTPATVTLTALDDDQQFTAVALDAAGNTVSGASISWETDDAAVVSMSSAGLGTAVAEGQTTVRASSGGVEGTSAVSVAQTVSAVGVSPSSASVAVGATVQLTASPEDANGNGVAGASVTWASLNSGVATVSATGVVTGVSVGSTMITAMSEGTVGSASVTVTATGNPPNVFFTEGFEDANVASRGWYDLSAMQVTSAEKRSGNSSLQMHFNQGASGPVGGGGRHLFTESESVYLGFWVKYSAGWVGSGYNAHPHEFYILTNEDTDWVGPAWTHFTLYVEHNYQQGGIPFIRAKDGQNIDVNNVNVDLTGVTEDRAAFGCNGNIDSYNTTCFSIGNGLYNNGKEWTPGQVYFSDAAGSRYKNDWHHIEVFAQLNSIQSGVGVADGIVQYWYDGQLIIDHQDVLLRTGAKSNMRFRHLLVAPFIGQGSPVAQTMWVDDLTVADRR